MIFFNENFCSELEWVPLTFASVQEGMVPCKNDNLGGILAANKLQTTNIVVYTSYVWGLGT